jgi:hypothetical protein
MGANSIYLALNLQSSSYFLPALRLTTREHTHSSAVERLLNCEVLNFKTGRLYISGDVVFEENIFPFKNPSSTIPINSLDVKPEKIIKFIINNLIVI